MFFAVVIGVAVHHRVRSLKPGFHIWSVTVGDNLWSRSVTSLRHVPNIWKHLSLLPIWSVTIGDGWRHGRQHGLRHVPDIWEHSKRCLGRSATHDLNDRKSWTWFYFPDRYDHADKHRFQWERMSGTVCDNCRHIIVPLKSRLSNCPMRTEMLFQHSHFIPVPASASGLILEMEC